MGRLEIVVLAALVAGCSASHAADDAGRPDAGRADDGGPSIDASAPRDAGPAPIDAGPACAAGEARFEPGCASGTDRVVAAGCYRPCTSASDCAGGLACQTVVVNPCVCRPGEPCCGACGAEQGLCLPPAPPVGCEGRSFCDCADGCEPLVDLTPGCICPCDDPFNCTGAICDCACGGAEYLGCGPAGACPTTELHCDPGCRAHLVDGCPACTCP